MYNRFSSNSIFTIIIIIMLVNGFLNFSEAELLNTLLILPGLILGLTIHEYSHAKMSDRLGDPTPEREGRLIPSDTLIDRLGIRKYVKDKVERRYIDFYPDTVYIPMSQHVGKPASAIVKIGDAVKKGQMIAKTDENALGTTIHSSIDGVVKSVNEKEIVISVIWNKGRELWIL